MAILVDGEIVLYGFVGDSFWDDGFTANEVLGALAEIGRGTDVVVRINSGGGYTDDGIAIYNALKAHKGRVDVIVDAIAASSASVIAMAGDSITMRAGALMMIHDPSGVTFGNADSHARSVAVLNKLADLMAGIYADTSGEDADAIRDDMKTEVWMTGAEAVARGYATATEGGEMQAVAAFDYRIYAHAPANLVAKAATERWSFDAAPLPAAFASQIPVHQKERPTMAHSPAPAKPTPAPAGPEPVSAADVKARIRAITGSESAKGHAGLAQHLAFETDMEAEDAIALLVAAAGDAATSSAVGATPAAPEVSTPDPAGYQASRSAAAALAQPQDGQPARKPTATIDTGGIYASRKMKGA